MLRVLIAMALLAMAVGYFDREALAQSPAPKMNSPGEIAAKSQVTAERRAKCLAEAKEQKLSLISGNRYVTKCVKDLGG